MTTVVPLRPPNPTCRYGYTSDQALTLVEELRQDDARVIPTQHAYDRMALRDITYHQVLRVLQRGRLVQGPELNDRMWRSVFRGDSAGQDISVVIDLDQDQMGNMIAVVTVVIH